MTTNDLKKVIRDLTMIPTMPTIVADALSTMKDPKSNVSELAEIISKDMSLTTKILNLVNSAYYGFPQQITTINKAVALLGMDKVRGLIMTVALKPILLSHGGKDLWAHSIRCAVGAEHIAESLKIIKADEAFTLGIIHDIGKTILEIYNKDALAEVNKLVLMGADSLAAEKMMFGFDHTEIGIELAEKWMLPSVIINCIEYHHKPHLSAAPAVIGIVYAADRIVQEPIKYPVLDSDILNSVGFDLADPHLLRDEIFRKSDIIIKTFDKK